MSNNLTARKPPNEWWVSIVAGMASYIDAAAIVGNGIALVLYQSAIGITADQLGILSAALTLAIAGGSIVGGRAGDHYGRRPVFIVTMLLIVIGSALNTWGTSFAPLLAGVLLVGLGVGADLPVSLATISEAASPRNRGKLIVLSNLLWLAGIMASVGIAAATGGLGRLGGQLLFGQVGVVALFVLLARLGIPESPSWLAAHAERRAGMRTARALHTGLADLTRGPYAKPFFALLAFYTLTNLAASTAGLFNSFIAVNLAGTTVETFNRIALLVLPLGAAISVFYMGFVDTRWRMPLYAVGAVATVAVTWVPAFLGFSLTTMAVGLALSAIAGSFAFEGVMKVWTQESFPTMLRATAQGAIIAVARISAALLAVITPSLLLSDGRAFYGVLGALAGVGLLVAWVVFSRRTATVFELEAESQPAADVPLRRQPQQA